MLRFFYFLGVNMTDSSRLPGVYPAKKKDGTIYYRASLTHRGKHISLGSYDTMKTANKAYEEACNILRSKNCDIEDYG